VPKSFVQGSSVIKKLRACQTIEQSRASLRATFRTPRMVVLMAASQEDAKKTWSATLAAAKTKGLPYLRGYTKALVQAAQAVRR